MNISEISPINLLNDVDNADLYGILPLSVEFVFPLFGVVAMTEFSAREDVCVDQPGRVEYEEAMEFAAEQERERQEFYRLADDWEMFWEEVRNGEF